MRVLVADDEAISRRILTAALTHLEHEVTEVVDGEQAWAVMARSDAPALAMLDWNMPGLDGPEVCRRLRRRGGGQYVYVILVTARSSHQDIVAGLEAGADDFITKPFEPEELRARVRAGQRIVELHMKHERALRYLDAVLTHVDSGVLLTDADGRVVYGNAAFARLAGTPIEEMIGKARREVALHHAHAFGDPRAARLAIAGATQQTPHRETDFGVEHPVRRTIRWACKVVALPEGEGCLDLFRDVTAEVDRERKREALIRTDALTGLQNRRGAEEAISREIAHARRHSTRLAFALCDVDHFKRVNDVLGHAEGDRVLVAISRVLTQTARGSDIAARWGGEEFLIVLPDTGIENARLFAERVRSALGSFHCEGVPPVTVSVGVSELTSPETTAGPALARADARLYAAKTAGRDRVL